MSYKVVFSQPGVVLLNCDARSLPLPDESVQCCVTSPPYWGLRDYGTSGQLGLEKTPDCLGWATGSKCGVCYVCRMVDVFHEVRRVLRSDGICWLNIGDSYSAHPGQRKETDKAGEKQQTKRGSTGSPSRCVQGLKPKDLVMIPARLALALQADGWYLRSDIIWSKPNPMPESVTDRPTKAHEYIFLMSKSAKYYYDSEAIEEKAVTSATSKSKCGFGSANGKCNDGVKAHTNDLGKRWEKSETKNRRSVWSFATQPYKEAHFATFPEVLPRLCVSAGSRVGDVVLDPFGGSGTTGKVALELGRKIVHVDIGYHDLAIKRMSLNAS